MTTQPRTLNLVPEEERGVALHTCTMCGKSSTWNKNWTWFGSYLDLEEGRTIVKLCCWTCRNQHNHGEPI